MTRETFAARKERLAAPTAASNRATRVRKATELFTFAPVKTTTKTKGRRGRKKNTEVAGKVKKGRVCLSISLSARACY